jgi:hypothetical protein
MGFEISDFCISLNVLDMTIMFGKNSANNVVYSPDYLEMINKCIQYI